MHINEETIFGSYYELYNYMDKLQNYSDPYHTH